VLRELIKVSALHMDNEFIGVALRTKPVAPSEFLIQPMVDQTRYHGLCTQCGSTHFLYQARIEILAACGKVIESLPCTDEYF
jgi:hypothetical protein